MTNYTSEIQLFVEKNMLEPPDRSGVYLSKIPSIPPGLIASGYVLSLGAGSHPGCLASEEIPFEPLPG